MLKPALFVLLALLPAAWAFDGSAAPARGHDPSGAKRNVLILHSYHASYNWTAELERGLEKPLLAQPYEVEIWTEYLDVKRVSASEHLERMRDLLEQKYSHQHLDLVIACDDDAVEFLFTHHQELFPGVPAVFCGVASQSLIARLPRQSFTGLTEYVDMHPWADIALRLRPGVRRLVIVTDASPNGAAIRDGLTRAAGDYRDLSFDYLDGSAVPFEEILARLRRLRSDSLVIASLFTHDATGRYLPASQSGASIAAAAPVPVISPNSSILGQGILLGNANNGFEHGRRAAALALRVLNGEAPSAVPISQHTEQSVVVDDLARRRWDIPLSRLPDDATIVNRSRARELYEDNRLLFWGCAAFFVLQACIIFVLALNIGRRRRAEQALRANQAMLEHSQRLAHVGSCRTTSTAALCSGRPRSTASSGARPLSRSPSTPCSASSTPTTRPASAPSPAAWPAWNACAPPSTASFAPMAASASSSAAPNGPSTVWAAASSAAPCRTSPSSSRWRPTCATPSASNRSATSPAAWLTISTTCSRSSTATRSSSSPVSPRTTPTAPSPKRLLKAGERAALLTRQLLAFSRRQMMQPQVLDLNAVVKGIESLIHPLIGETIHLDVRLSPEPCPLLADRTQLEQALLNLSANAHDAMPGGGTLTVTTRAERLLELTSWDGLEISPGDYVVLEVSDTASAWTPPRANTSLSRFSPPRRSAKAPASACRASTASSSRVAASSPS